MSPVCSRKTRRHVESELELCNARPMNVEIVRDIGLALGIGAPMVGPPERRRDRKIDRALHLGILQETIALLGAAASAVARRARHNARVSRRRSLAAPTDCPARAGSGRSSKRLMKTVARPRRPHQWDRREDGRCWWHASKTRRQGSGHGRIAAAALRAAVSSNSRETTSCKAVACSSPASVSKDQRKR